MSILSNILFRSFFGDAAAAEEFSGVGISHMFSELFNDITIQSLDPKGFILGQWIHKLGLT